MTKLTVRPLVRETAEREHADPLVIELHPKHLVLRVKGERGEGNKLTYAYLRRIQRSMAVGR